MGLFSRLTEKRIAAYQRELIETHYAEVENMYRQIRGWRHDFRNHIQTMKAYAAAEDWQAVRRYLDELDGDLAAVDPVIKTGNPMADAILNSKISLARSKDIPVTADAHIPVALKLSEIDLCCIIGNLFDNAIEASLQLPPEKRLIRVYLDMKNTQLYLSFTNFTAGEKAAPGGRIVPHYEGGGPRLRPAAHRRDCEAAGRLPEPPIPRTARSPRRSCCPRSSSVRPRFCIIRPPARPPGVFSARMAM